MPCKHSDYSYSTPLPIKKWYQSDSIADHRSLLNIFATYLVQATVISFMLARLEICLPPVVRRGAAQHPRSNHFDIWKKFSLTKKVQEHAYTQTYVSHLLKENHIRRKRETCARVCVCSCPPTVPSTPLGGGRRRCVSFCLTYVFLRLIWVS